MLYLLSEHFVVIRSQQNTILQAPSLRGRHFFDIFSEKMDFLRNHWRFFQFIFLFYSLGKALHIIPNNMVSQTDSLDQKWQNVSHSMILRIFFVFWLAPVEILKKHNFFCYKLFILDGFHIFRGEPVVLWTISSTICLYSDA